MDNILFGRLFIGKWMTSYSVIWKTIRLSPIYNGVLDFGGRPTCHVSTWLHPKLMPLMVWDFRSPFQWGESFPESFLIHEERDPTRWRQFIVIPFHSPSHFLYVLESKSMRQASNVIPSALSILSPLVFIPRRSNLGSVDLVSGPPTFPWIMSDSYGSDL